MRVLLDENMPESVRAALQELGRYDLCFTKDADFVRIVRTIDRPGSVKVLRVTIPQTPRGRFTGEFIEAFQRTDWSAYPNGSDWPA